MTFENCDNPLVTADSLESLTMEMSLDEIRQATEGICPLDWDDHVVEAIAIANHDPLPFWEAEYQVYARTQRNPKRTVTIERPQPKHVKNVGKADWYFLFYLLAVLAITAIMVILTVNNSYAAEPTEYVTIKENVPCYTTDPYRWNWSKDAVNNCYMPEG